MNRPQPKIECIVTPDTVHKAILDLTNRGNKATKDAIAEHMECHVDDLHDPLYTLQKENDIAKDFTRGGYKIA